jgi:hypothetical protein
MTNADNQGTRPRYLEWRHQTGTFVKALLPLSLLLLSGCFDPTTDASGGSGAPQTMTQSGGGSSGSGGSSGGGTSPPSPPPPVGPAINPSGIWDIVDTVNGNAITEVALIGAGKYFAFANVDEFGCADLSGGTYTIDKSIFKGSGMSLLMNNCTAPNGEGGYLPYTFNGYLTGADLNLTLEVSGMLIPTLGATMDALYNEPSSLARLTGNWSDAGNTLTINADGTFSELQSSGCVVSGAYTIIDATHNLYGVSLEITNCNSSVAGIAFTGLGYLDDSNPTAWHFFEGLSGPDPANPGAAVLVSDTITPQ